MDLHSYLQSLYTSQTVKAYEREIMIFVKNVPKARSIFHKELVAYIGNLRTRYTNARTMHRIVASIKVYYDYLHYSGQRTDNPAKTIRLRDKQNRDIQLQDLFTTEELEKLITAKKERYATLEYRNQVIISLLVYQALHPAEMEALRVQDINLDTARIYIQAQAKTNARELPLKNTQILLFHRYIYEIRPKLLQKKVLEHNEDPVPESLLIGHRGEVMRGEDVTKHIRRHYSTYYKDRKINAQTIRQSVITNLLKSGNDLRMVQSFAGHKYPSTTERYKQSGIEELKTAVSVYHPIR